MWLDLDGLGLWVCLWGRLFLERINQGTKTYPQCVQLHFMGWGRLNKSSKEKDKGQQNTDSPLSLFLSFLVFHACCSAMLVTTDRALWNHEPKPWIPPLSCFTHVSHHINEKVANTEDDVWNFSTNDWPQETGDWRKPQMNEVLCECTLCTRAWAMRVAKPSLHRGGKPSFGLWIMVEWVENVQTDPLQELFLRRWPNSASLCNCMLIILPPGLSVYNNPTSLFSLQ